MRDSNTAINQQLGEKHIGGGIYVAIDGLLKHCITAPLLELPIDFKEWYIPIGSNISQLYPL
ncbi:hypothetical protein U737_17650 [Methylomonas sp. LW13]|uniref:hypothetical protein n=1 Tax=unclassified Methylomonas TaxID=2608980 RepID=UPI00051C9496|nr:MULTISPECIES: hypothetical protein [unclassified Methylomonas]PKD38624.1 hypothetical protein CWO84_20575 [Methylomonas sp. Kb3]QBC28588.1 hypothetical protein U737_17650 [Methylomonas sp. LW13]